MVKQQKPVSALFRRDQVIGRGTFGVVYKGYVLLHYYSRSSSYANILLE